MYSFIVYCSYNRDYKGGVLLLIISSRGVPRNAAKHDATTSEILHCSSQDRESTLRVFQL